MAQVQYNNLFSESRTNVVALINSDVDDPISTSSEYRKWVYSRQPDAKYPSFAGYPLLIVNHTDVDIEEEGSVDGKSKVVSWDIEVEIVTSDRGYGDKSGNGATDMDSISDSLVTTFMNKTNRNTLRNLSMNFSIPTTTAVTTEVIQNELTFRRSILLSFKSRIQISA